MISGFTAIARAMADARIGGGASGATVERWSFPLRLLFLVSVTIAAPVARNVGASAALLLCAVLIAGAGAFALLWGRREATLMRVEQSGR